MVYNCAILSIVAQVFVERNVQPIFLVTDRFSCKFNVNYRLRGAAWWSNRATDTDNVCWVRVVQVVSVANACCIRMCVAVGDSLAESQETRMIVDPGVQIFRMNERQ